MTSPVPPELVVKALRKILAAIEGLGHKAVAIGPMAHQSWGSKREVQGVELLISSGEAHRATLLGAARGEGLQQVSGGGPLSMRFPDPRTGGTVDVEMTEATTPLHKQAMGRAQPGAVLQMPMAVATCEDLILLRAGSAVPADREMVVELLRWNAGRIDAAYVKREAEAAGIFDKLKSAWQEAKQKA